MPRKIVLSSLDVNGFGAIGAQFDQVVEDGDLKLVQTNVRRMIMPDQDIDQNCDDLDAYFQSNGYPVITPEDRQTIKDARMIADANPEIATRRDAWLAQQEAQKAAMQPAPEPAA